MSSALASSGLINSFEQQLIAAAEFSGRTAEGLRAIAKSYDKRRQRVGRLKAKLFLPFAVLVIGILTSAILKLSGDQPSSIVLVIMQALFYIFIALLLTRWLLSIFRKDVSSLLSRLKYLKSTKLYRLIFEQTVFGALLWQLKSGIDFEKAFINIASLLKDKPISNKLKIISRKCAQGARVSESIRASDLPITNEFLQILTVAEASGNWEGSVGNYLQKQSAMVDLGIDEIYEWVPKLYYSIVALIAIMIIL